MIGDIGHSRSRLAVNRRHPRWGHIANAFWRPRPVIGIVVFAVLLVAAVGANWLAPHDPVKSDLALRLVPPSLAYPFGTDWIGRCLLSRILYGSRLTLLVGLLTVLAGGGMGVALGLLAGFFGGIAETGIMRITDLLLAFPYFLLTIVLVAVLGPSLLNAMVAIAVWTIPQYIRLVRSLVLTVKTREFVEAARALGRTEFGVLIHHVFPSCIPAIVVQSAIFCAQNMLMGASLSFLGLGAQPPSPEIGAMLGAGRAYLQSAPQVVAFPALAIFLAVLAFNFLGDALRDMMDPGVAHAG